MRSGSMRPEFSSTIFFWRSKKGTLVGHSRRPSAPVSRLRMISGAASGVTLAYILPSVSTETSGPALHSPMQPTPFTSTSPCMPDSATSFFRASRTWSLAEERQPAAMQTCTWCWYFFCAACSASPILRSSSMVMTDAFPDAFPDAREHVAWPDFAQDGAIHHHRGSQAAGAEAARGQYGEFAIGRSLARFDAVLPLQCREQGGSAFDVAGGPGAHHASMFPLGFEGEEVVEGGGSVDAAERHAEGGGDEPQGGLIQIAEGLLDCVEGLDERMGFAAVAAGRSLDDSPALIVRGKLGRAQVRLHKDWYSALLIPDDRVQSINNLRAVVRPAGREEWRRPGERPQVKHGKTRFIPNRGACPPFFRESSGLWFMVGSGDYMTRTFITLFAIATLAAGARAAEKSLALKDLPPAVQKTIQDQTKNAEIKNIGKETEHGVAQYEVETMVNGKHRDFNVDTKGVLVVVEEETTIDAIPAAAKAAIEKKVGSGKLGLVEIMTKGTGTFYEAAYTNKAGKKLEVLVKPDGTESKD